jgi:PAS domain S-box-containing protein
MSNSEGDELCRLLIARVRDYAIFMLSPDGKVISWNDGAQAIKGYAEEEIIGQPMTRFYTPEDVDARRHVGLLREATEKGRVEDQGWRVRKDGTRFWADVVITALRDESGRLRGFAKITRDLTEQRKAQTAISDLSGRLLKIQDAERRRLGTLLFDRTSPQLTGVLGSLHRLVKRVAMQDREASQELASIIAKTEATAEVIQQISHMLHPPILEQGGLVEALRWYLETVRLDNRSRVEAELPSRHLNLSKDAEIALFRLVQECLTHLLGGGADRRVRVQVTDNGSLVVKIMVHGSLSPSIREDVQAARGDFGAGLAGMRERLRQLGGTFAITSGGDETAIEASLPMSA